MKLCWDGHASFSIESSAGIRVVTDPYDWKTSGFKPFSDPADVVIMSSDTDTFHNNSHLVPKRDHARVFNALEIARSGDAVESHGLEFQAIEAAEHAEHPHHDPEANAMYRFVIDGVSVGHMGDMGNAFSDRHLKFFDNIDVLLSLAGGFPVIDLQELKRVVDRIRPRWVIPMHFRTLCFRPREMHWISEFLRLFPADDIDFGFDCEVEISTGSLPSSTRALVLDYR